MSQAPVVTAPEKADTAGQIDPVTDLLGGGRIVAFRVDLALAVGGISAGLLLSQFWFWTNVSTTEKRDGWFWMTADDISAQTGLSREEQMTARKRLRNLNVIEEDKRGVPMKLWFRVCKPELIALLRQYVEDKSYLWAMPKDELEGKPKDELEGFPIDGNPQSYLTGMPKDNVGQFRHIARGKAQGLVAGIPIDITKTSSEMSSPTSLNMSSEGTGAPSNKFDPPRGEGEGTEIGADETEVEPDTPLAFYWSRALKQLRQLVNVPTYEQHLRALVPISFTEGTVDGNDDTTPGGDILVFKLAAPTRFTYTWLRDKYLEVICVALEKETGMGVTVDLVWAGASNTASPELGARTESGDVN